MAPALPLRMCLAAATTWFVATGTATAAQWPLPGGEATNVQIAQPWTFPWWNIGHQMDPFEDVDGDGALDLLVGCGFNNIPWTGNLARVAVVSRYGNVVWHKTLGPNAQPRTVRPVTDIDGDGLRDVAGVVSSQSGASLKLLLLSGADGSALGMMPVDFTVLEDAGDVDGDGSGDLACSDPSGDIVVRRGLDGQPLGLLPAPPGASLWGGLMRPIADLDADGTQDLVVTYKDASGGPRIRALNPRTGQTIWDAPGHGRTAAERRPSLDCSGDVDGDGLADVALGAPWMGRAAVYSGADGALLVSIRGSRPDQFGFAVCIGGDLDGDGLDDLAVGAPFFGPSWTEGRTSVYRSSDWACIFREQGTLSNHGYSLAYLPDHPAGDRDLLMIGSPDYTTNSDGTIYRASFDPYLGAGSTSLSLGLGQPLALEVDYPATWQGSAYQVLVSMSGTGPATVGGIQVPLGDDPYLQASASGVLPPVFAGISGSLDGQGDDTFYLLPVAPLAPWIGNTLYVGVVLVHPTQGFQAPSMSVPVTILP